MEPESRECGHANGSGDQVSGEIPARRDRGPPASSESDQLVADGLVLSVPPSSARKS